MNEQEILAGAPDGNCKSVKMLGDRPAIWVPENYRSLSDIKTIVEQQKRIAELEKQLATAEKVVLSYDMSFKERDIRDLEQQAKGVREFGEWYESTNSDSVFDDVTVGDLAELKANSISADAKQLREGEQG